MAENSATKQPGLFYTGHRMYQYQASGASINTGAPSSLGDIKLSSIVLFHLFILCLQIASCADITVKCPTEFIQNTIGYVDCIFDRTVIDSANCFIPPTSIDFGIVRPPSLSTSLLCNSAPAYPCTSHVNKPTVHRDCACTNVNGNELTYTMAYNATSMADTGAKFVCQICAGPSFNVNSPTCDSIKVTTGSNGQVSTSPSSCEGQSCNNQTASSGTDNTTRDILLGVLIPAISLIVVGIVVAVVKIHNR